MILTARNLVKEYARGGKPFRAVDEVSLGIGKGEFVCIEGRSGSGKSTLLNLLAGILTPTSGEIRFEGKDYGALDDRESSLLRSTKLGYIMQGQSVLPNLTVLQNVLLPFVFSRRSCGREKALSLLEKAGLLPLAAQYPQDLSGGEMRRVSIVRALLPSPELLIADEPTGDLDAETTEEILDLFRAATKEGTAVLMVTHDRDAARFAGRLLTMQAGRLSAADPL